MRQAPSSSPAEKASHANSGAALALAFVSFAALRVWFLLVAYIHATIPSGEAAAWATGGLVAAVAIARLLANLGIAVGLCARKYRDGTAPPPSREPSHVLCGPTCIVICTIVLIVSTVFVTAAARGWIGGMPLLVCGALLCGVAGEVLVLTWSTLFVGLSQRTVEGMLLIELAAEAVFAFVALLPLDVAFVVCLALPALVAWGALRASDIPASAKSPAKRTWHTIDHKMALPVCLGTALMFFGLYFATTGFGGQLSMPAGTSEVTSGMWTTIAGRWFGLAVMAIGLRFARDFHFEALFRISVIIAIAGFLLLPLPFDLSFPLFMVAIIGASLVFENTVTLTCVSLARYSTAEPVSILNLGRTCLHLGGALGVFAGVVLAPYLTQAHESGMQAYVASLVVMVLVVAGMWLLREQVVNALLWGRGTLEARPETTDAAVTSAAQASSKSPADPFAAQPASPTTAMQATCRYLTQLYQLTEREAEVLGLLLEGRSVPFISEFLHVGTATVKTHIHHIYQKTGVHNRQALITIAQEAPV